jgi:hypothetical protein
MLEATIRHVMLREGLWIRRVLFRSQEGQLGNMRTLRHLAGAGFFVASDQGDGVPTN